MDLLIGEQLVVELKAVESISRAHMAQALGYLVSGGFELALIINFNVAVVREGIRRVIFTPDPSDPFAPSCLRGRS
jgi:GxxExxY protein